MAGNAGKGAPKGNTNAKRGARWRNALEREISEEELSQIARVVKWLALSGDKDAIREIADRFDGKAHQSMSVEHTTRDLTDAELESRIAEYLGKTGTVEPARREAETIQ
jgi:histidinol dehydrogenase